MLRILSGSSIAKVNLPFALSGGSRENCTPSAFLNSLGKRRARSGLAVTMQISLGVKLRQYMSTPYASAMAQQRFSSLAPQSSAFTFDEKLMFTRPC